MFVCVSSVAMKRNLFVRCSSHGIIAKVNIVPGQLHVLTLLVGKIPGVTLARPTRRSCTVQPQVPVLLLAFTFQLAGKSRPL